MIVARLIRGWHGHRRGSMVFDGEALRAIAAGCAEPAAIDDQQTPEVITTGPARPESEHDDDDE